MKGWGYYCVGDVGCTSFLAEFGGGEVGRGSCWGVLYFVWEVELTEIDAELPGDLLDRVIFYLSYTALLMRIFCDGFSR